MIAGRKGDRVIAKPKTIAPRAKGRPRMKATPKRKKQKQAWLAKRNASVTPAQLLAEGIDDPRKDIGMIAGTAMCFVRTRAGLHLFHIARMEERRLDAYAMQLVKGWFESGHTMNEIASNLDVDKMWLIRELDRVGYQRPGLTIAGPRAGSGARLTRRSRARRLTAALDGTGERLPAITGKHSGKHRVPTIHYLLA